MLLSQIIERVNERLAGETLSYREMVKYLDMAVDDINQKLNTVYPVFGDLPVGTLDYGYFPDRYIRGVVCLGAAVHFYMMDEEGGTPPPGYQVQYEDNLFKMLRDYVHLVEDEYKTKTTAGTVSFNLTGANHVDDIDPRYGRI